MARRLWLGLLLGCELVAARVRAGDPTELVYVRSGRAEACPDQAALERAVSERLGYSPFFPVAGRKIVAEIWGTGDLLHARARLVEQGGVVRGSRELAAPAAQCGELLASLALAVSITLDPMSMSRPASAPAEDTPASPAHEEPVHPPAAGEPPRQAPSHEVGASDVPSSSEALAGAGRRSFALLASAGAIAAVGALPRLSPGLRLGLEARGRFLSLAIEGAGLAAVSASAPFGGEARFSLLFASAVPCARAAWAKGCAVATFGRLSGEGRGVTDARRETRSYAALGLRFEAAWLVVGNFELALHAGANKTLSMPSFQLAGAEVWRPPPFSADAGLALSLRFL